MMDAQAGAEGILAEGAEDAPRIVVFGARTAEEELDGEDHEERDQQRGAPVEKGQSAARVLQVNGQGDQERRNRLAVLLEGLDLAADVAAEVVPEQETGDRAVQRQEDED